MSKDQNPTEDNSRRELYHVIQPVTWKGEECHFGDIIEFSQAVQHVNRDRWLKKKSIRAVTEEERARALTISRYVVDEQIMWHTKRYPAGTILEIESMAVDSKLVGFERDKKIHAASEEECKALAAEAVTLADPAGEMAAGDGKLIFPRPHEIAPSPVNPRRHFEEAAMQELVDSVGERGVRIAINVRPMPVNAWFVEPGKQNGKEGWFLLDRRRFRDFRGTTGQVQRTYEHIPDDIFQHFFPTEEEARSATPKWEIIAGERRWRAARYAGSETIRAIVEDMDDVAAAELQVIENDQRADLRPLETAAGYAYLLRQPGYDMAKLIQKTGKAKNTVYGKLKLLDLPEEARAAVDRGDLPEVTAEKLARLTGEVQRRVVTIVLNPPPHTEAKVLSTRDTDRQIQMVKKAVADDEKRGQIKADAEKRGLPWLDEKSIDRYGSVKSDSGYVRLTERCEGHEAWKSYAELLRSAAGKKVAKEINPAAAYCPPAPYQPELIEVYDRKALRAALVAAGIKLSNRKEPADQEEAKRRRRDKRMKIVLDRSTEIICAGTQDLVPRIAQTEQAKEIWHLLAHAAVYRASSDALRALIKRRSLELVRGKPYTQGEQGPADFRGTVWKFLAGQPVSGMVSIVAELLLCSGSWSHWSTDFTEPFLKVAAAFKVDLRAFKIEAGATPEEIDKEEVEAKKDSSRWAEDEDDEEGEQESASARTQEEPAEPITI